MFFFSRLKQIEPIPEAYDVEWRGPYYSPRSGRWFPSRGQWFSILIFSLKISYFLSTLIFIITNETGGTKPWKQVYQG
jgi:hypothetical protein